MTPGFEIGAQLAIVINLAVEDHGDTMTFVECWLLAGNQIDNCQAPHPERDSIIHQIPFGIRAAMNHAITHGAQEILDAFRWRRARIEVGPTGYSAHW